MKHTLFHEGMFTRDPVTGLFEPYVPDPAFKHPGLVIFGLIVAAWSLFGGIAYAIYRSAEVLAS